MWHRNRQQKLQPIILHIAAFNSRHSFSSLILLSQSLWQLAVKMFRQTTMSLSFLAKSVARAQKTSAKKKELLLLRHVHTRTPRVPRSAPLNNTFFSPNILDSHKRLQARRRDFSKYNLTGDRRQFLVRVVLNSTYLADISSLIPRSRNRLVNVTPVVPVTSSGYLKHTRKTQSSETTAKLLKRGHQVSSNLSVTALVFLYCPVFICIILPRIASGRETHVVWRVRPGCIVKYLAHLKKFSNFKVTFWNLETLSVS